MHFVLPGLREGSVIGQGNWVEAIGRNTQMDCQSSLEDKEREKGKEGLGDREGEEGSRGRGGSEEERTSTIRRVNRMMCR